MATTIVTPELRAELSAMFNGLSAALLPAKLRKDTKHNGMVIAQEITKRGLSFTAENAMVVVKAILHENKLLWEVEPAALKPKKQNADAATPTSVQAGIDARTQQARAAEKAEAYAKEQDEYEKTALQLIESFLPMTRGGQRVDYRKKDEVQRLLNNHVAREKFRGCDLREVHKIVAAHIQKEYEAIERASERM